MSSVKVKVAAVSLDGGGGEGGGGEGGGGDGGGGDGGGGDGGGGGRLWRLLLRLRAASDRPTHT